MLDAALYFFVCYIFVIPIAVLILMLALRKVKPAFKRRICLLFAFSVLMLPLMPYAQVELQTLAYGATLRPVAQSIVEEQNWCKSPILCLKVLSIGPGQATIFVVSTRTDPKPLCARGETLSLQKTPHGWHLLELDTVWSDCGSASGNIFPPYRAKGEYSY